PREGGRHGTVHPREPLEGGRSAEAGGRAGVRVRGRSGGPFPREAGATHIQVDEPAITRAPKDVGFLREGLETIAAEKGSSWLCLFTFFGDAAGILGDLASLPIDNLGLDLVQGDRNWKALGKSGSEIPLTLGLVDARNTRRDDPNALSKAALT